MKIKAASGVLAGTLAVTGLLAGTAVPAHAVTAACPAKVALRNVSITHSSHVLSTRLSQTCNAEYATWHVADSRGEWSGFFIFDPAWTDTDSITIYDWDPVGRWTTYPDVAWDAGYNDVPQATQTFDVRYGSRAAITATRSGSYVYLRANSTRYNPNANWGLGGFTAFAGRKVTFQYRVPGTSAWRYVATSYTGSNGFTPFKKIKASNAYYWRAVVTGTSAVWGSASAQVKR